MLLFTENSLKIKNLKPISHKRPNQQKMYTAIIEKYPETGI